MIIVHVEAHLFGLAFPGFKFMETSQTHQNYKGNTINYPWPYSKNMFSQWRSTTKWINTMICASLQQNWSFQPTLSIQGARGSTWWHHKPKHHIYSYNYGHRPDQRRTCLWWQTGEFDGDWCWYVSKGEIRGCARLRLKGLLVIRRIFTDLDWF